MKTMVSGGSNAVVISVMGTEAIAALWDLRWMLVLIVVLIIADFWFGVSESIYKKDEFRFSRAGRRTCNKAIDYVTYLIVGTLLGMAIFEPLGWCTHITTAAIGLGFGCIWEIDSIVGHVCVLHGVENRFSVKKFFVSLIKKHNKNVGEAIEEAIDEDKC